MKRRLWLSVAAALAASAAMVVACSGGDAARPVGPAPPGLAAAAAGSGVDAGDGGAEPCTQLPIPDSGPLTITGTVYENVPDASPRPLANAMVAAEYGGLYLTWCDLAHASPYYQFGAYTDANGKFTVQAHAGILGFHSFATGFLYNRARLDTATSTDVVLHMEPIKNEKKPAVTAAGFAATTVAPGGSLTFTATAAAADRTNDPLSDELMLVEPTQSFATELDPPSVGLKDDFPDGVWKKTFPAPTKKGTYTYYFSATTAHCVSSDVQPFPITVQ